MFNQVITIINKRFNKTTREYDYIVNSVNGFWSSNNGIVISNVMLLKNSGVVARILLSESGYLDPITFKSSTSTNNWTLQNDDYIIKGAISETTNININDIIKKYDCKKINNVAIKDYGSTDMQHFEITGE